MKRIMIVIMLALVVVSPIAYAGKAREVRGPETIGITNDIVEMAFDAKTGALVRLKNLAADDEYLKDRSGEGNPFRIYLDPKTLPAAVTDPAWWSGKIEGNMGGQTVDAAQCAVVGAACGEESGGAVLDVSARHAESGLEFALRIVLKDDACAADWTLTVRNHGNRPHALLTAFPHFTGLQLGASRDTNRSLMLASYGTPDVAAWTDGGGIYGREVTMQWQAVYDPPRNDGLGFIVMDKDLAPKLIRRFAPSGMSVLYFPETKLDPGQSFTFPVTRIVVHRGNWRVVAQEYRAWFEKSFALRKHPDWLRDVDLFVGTWIPNAEAVAKAKEQAGPDQFKSFRDMPLLYLNDAYDLKEWAQYNEGVAANPETYGAYMADGTFLFRSDLGGPQAMREGVEAAHKIGRRVQFYVAGYSVLKDSAVFKGTDIKNWLLLDTPNHMWDIGYPNGVSVCPGYPPRQDQLAATCTRILAESGADGIRLDELGSFVPCHNPAHHHASPYDSIQWHRQLLAKVRAAMDEVNPQAILCTEGPIDIFREQCDAALQMFQPGRDIDAMRVAVPSYVGFAYHPGAVESGLNGWAGGKTTARRVEWPWAHRGLATRPDWYQQGPGPELRWQELRASFSEAIVEGDVTLDDPIAPDDPHWVGRLWRAPHYWLLVGGHLDATALAGPLAVRLPELPDGVACAFEIDAATLDIADAHLTRDAEKIGMTVTRRFSVVLLPLPGCPPMARIDSPTPVLDRDKDTVINTTLFGPWNPGKNTAAVHIAAPGLELNSNTATLPAPIAIRVPLETKPGCYPLTITGDCLKLKRWIRVG